MIRQRKRWAGDPSRVQSDPGFKVKSLGRSAGGSTGRDLQFTN